MTLKKLRDIPAQIMCFASSRKFNRVVAGCEDGKLRIWSMASGMKIVTLNLDKEVPVAVLITRGWGMNMVKTAESIFVFDVNGFRSGKRIGYAESSSGSRSGTVEASISSCTRTAR